MNRQSGETTKQMLNAPQGAFYVWPNQFLFYAKSLAMHHGRSDLTIITPTNISLQLRNIRSTAPVVIDHAAYGKLSSADLLEIDRYNHISEEMRNLGMTKRYVWPPSPQLNEMKKPYLLSEASFKYLFDCNFKPSDDNQGKKKCDSE